MRGESQPPLGERVLGFIKQNQLVSGVGRLVVAVSGLSLIHI